MAVAFAGLFRSNSGVFTFVAGVVLIVTVSGGPREKALRIAAFAGIIFLCAMPWLGWIAAKKKLLAYLVHLSVVRFRISPGATPPPPCAIRCQCDLLGWASTGVVGLSPRAGGVSRGMVAVICLTLVIGAMASLDAAQLWPAAAAKKCNTYNASRDELLVAVRASRTNFRAELYEYVRDHSAPDEGVFATNAVRPFRIRSIKPRWSSGLERRIGHCRVLTPRWRKGAPLGAPNWWDPPPRRRE